VARNCGRILFQALPKGNNLVISAGDSRRRRTIALALGIVCLGCIALGGNKIAFYAGYAVMRFWSLPSCS